MSKPVKQLIRKELIRRFEGLSSVAVVGFTGIDANTTRDLRANLREKDIHITVVKNTIARNAFRELGMEHVSEVLDGPCAIAYGTSDEVSVVNVVRELLDIKKATPQLEVKGAVLEGDVFGAERIEELSKFPTREEALAKLVSVILSGGSKLAACAIAPGSKIAGILKKIQEDQEGGEAEAA